MKGVPLLQERFLHILNPSEGAVACSVCQADLTREPHHTEILATGILKGMPRDVLDEMSLGVFLALF